MSLENLPDRKHLKPNLTVCFQHLSTGKTDRVRAKKANIELKLESANGVGVRTQTTAIGAMQSGQATHEHSQYLYVPIEQS